MHFCGTFFLGHFLGIFKNVHFLFAFANSNCKQMVYFFYLYFSFVLSSMITMICYRTKKFFLNNKRILCLSIFRTTVICNNKAKISECIERIHIQHPEYSIANDDSIKSPTNTVIFYNLMPF